MRDLSRPESRETYSGVVIEWIGQEPRIPVQKVGDRSEPPEGFELSYTAHLRNLSGKNSEPLLVRWMIDGSVAGTETLPGIGAGRTARSSIAWTAVDGRHWIQCELVGTGEWLTIASDALTVRVLVEKATLASHEAVAGSFARRLQDSFARLHASWSAIRQAPWAIEGVTERFRIDAVEVFERAPGGSGVPAAFRAHPDADLLLLCDAGGPVAGCRPEDGSVGFAFAAEGTAAPLFSPKGERFLWRDLGRSRGVPDFAAFLTRPGEVAFRLPSGEFIEPLRLRPEFEQDIMFDASGEGTWSDYSAIAIQMKRGIARLGRWDDPHNTFGHLWRHLPAQIEVQVIDRDGKPLRRVEVEIYRPVRSGEEGRPRIEAGAEPLFRGETSAEGMFTLGDDPFGRRKVEAQRAPWILVVLRRNGVARYRYLTLLEMNMRYWRDEKDRAHVPVVWTE